MQFTLQHLQNSVTAPKGFKAAAVASGIRYHERTDLALIVSDVQAECAAVYTQTTDVEGEVNGLVTYDREVVKVDVDRLHEVNRRLVRSLDL